MPVLPDPSTEVGRFELLVLGFAAIAALTFPLLFFVSAPYGRHLRGGWGPRIDATVGWVVMEAPAPIAFALCYVLGDPAHTQTPAAVAFLVIWQAHYRRRLASRQ